jgi:hypothetical protein
MGNAHRQNEGAAHRGNGCGVGGRRARRACGRSTGEPSPLPLIESQLAFLEEGWRHHRFRYCDEVRNSAYVCSMAKRASLSSSLTRGCDWDERVPQFDIEWFERENIAYLWQRKDTEARIARNAANRIRQGGAAGTGGRQGCRTPEPAPPPPKRLVAAMSRRTEAYFPQPVQRLNPAEMSLGVSP